jgi:hypothetical protein
VRKGETKKRWRELCERAMAEQDPDRFESTIQELLQALEEKDKTQRNAADTAPRQPQESPGTEADS